MTDKSSDNCPFCQIDSEETIIDQNKVAFAIYDKYPVTEGHTLIIPNRHEPNYFDLSQEEQQQCWALVNEVHAFLSDRLETETFNISVNIGSRAGQTVWHAHIHLIPRGGG